MDLIISPKDNINKIELHDVETYYIEGPTLLVVFADGRCRNFPLVHIWYYQSNPKNPNRSRPPIVYMDADDNEIDPESMELEDRILKALKKDRESPVIINDDMKIRTALRMIGDYGDTDGAHHKMWVLDQVVRILADDYDAWLKEHLDGEDGPNTYGWDEGIAP